MREQPLDSLGPVDPLDDDGQVGHKVGDTGHMQFAVRAETGQTADHCRASRALFAEIVQDGLPEWVVVPAGLVMLPDVDANTLARPYDVHSLPCLSQWQQARQTGAYPHADQPDRIAAEYVKSRA